MEGVNIMRIKDFRSGDDSVPIEDIIKAIRARNFQKVTITLQLVERDVAQSRPGEDDITYVITDGEVEDKILIKGLKLPDSK